VPAICARVLRIGGKACVPKEAAVFLPKQRNASAFIAEASLINLLARFRRSLPDRAVGRDNITFT
jgi:hypothetical protein